MKMTIDIARLQTLADNALGAGVVNVQLLTRKVLVLDLDRRGRNRAAPWTVCGTCNGQREVQDAIGLWDDCDVCGGEGMVMGDVPAVDVPVLAVAVAKLRTAHQLPLLVDDGGRADQWQAITQDAIDAFLQSLVQRLKNKG